MIETLSKPFPEPFTDPLTEDSLFLEQVNLEQEGFTLGKERFEARIAKALTKGQRSRTPGGLRAMGVGIEPMVVAIREWIAAAATSGSGRRHSCLADVQGTAPDVLAVLTLRTIFDAGANNGSVYQKVCKAVGASIEQEGRLREFKKINERWFKWTKNQVSRSTDPRYRSRVITAAMTKNNIAWESWDDRRKIALGALLIDILERSTKMVVLVKRARRKDTTINVLIAPETLTWINQFETRAALFCPIRLPMIHPPRDWYSPSQGGYLTPVGGILSLVKTRRTNYLRELAAAHMPTVYAAVNHLQQTQWEVNPELLEVVPAALKAGLKVADYPSDNERPIPDKPADIETNEEARKAWRRAATLVHEERIRDSSLRCRYKQIMGVAAKVKGRAFYHPYQLDFRGRVYTIAALSPQGCDLSRGLVRFRRKLPIGDEIGVHWLCVAIANAAGADKLPFEQRVQWVQTNESEILRIAADPLENTSWTEADSPLQYLAGCFEYAGLWADGLKYESGFPVMLDGSCSGLQHFSAMLRDPIGGAAVNLIPSDRPRDIYADVAALTTAKLAALAAAGDDTAAKWLTFGIDRTMTKRCVMTLPYGAKRFAHLTFIREAYSKKVKDGAPELWNRSEIYTAAPVLGAAIWEAIGETVVSARDAMTWLQGAAKLAAADGLPVSWRTPIGFPVLQDYRDTAACEVKVTLGDKVRKIQLSRETERISKSKQGNGISPNFVHSMDASALMLAVVAAKDSGIRDLAVVHDSFGTHAANTDRLSQLLRSSFVELYEGNDVLADFRKELSDQIGKELPPVPPRGELELKEVLDSEYCFA